MPRPSLSANQGMIKDEDAKSIAAYSHYLVMKAQLIGNLCFDGHRPSEEENIVAEQCRMVCGKISRSLDICKVNEIPDLLEYYDIIYRIGNKRLPDHSFIIRHKQRVITAWKAGDPKIEESSVFGIVAPQISHRPEKADKEYFAVYHFIKEKWIATLKEFGTFPEVTTYENYQRLSMMMRENLDKELGNEANDAKHRWYERNKIEDFSNVGSYILLSYRRFNSSLFPKVLDFETQMSLDSDILSELAIRTDLNSYDREAFAMALEYTKKME